MADVITLKNGRNEIVFDKRGFLELVDEHMGPEARRWLEDWLSEKNAVFYWIFFGLPVL